MSLYAADDQDEADRLTLGAFIFRGDAFVRPMTEFRPGRAEYFPDGPWRGLFVDRATYDRIRDSLGLPRPAPYDRFL